jgi:hypothetical protein
MRKTSKKPRIPVDRPFLWHTWNAWKVLHLWLCLRFVSGKSPLSWFIIIKNLVRKQFMRILRGTRYIQVPFQSISDRPKFWDIFYYFFTCKKTSGVARLLYVTIIFSYFLHPHRVLTAKIPSDLRQRYQWRTSASAIWNTCPTLLTVVRKPGWLMSLSNREGFDMV